MTNKELLQSIDTCLKRMGMGKYLTTTEDPQEDAEFAIRDGYLWVGENPLPFKAEEFESVRFRKDYDADVDSVDDPDDDYKALSGNIVFDIHGCRIVCWVGEEQSWDPDWDAYIDDSLSDLTQQQLRVMYYERHCRENGKDFEIKKHWVEEELKETLLAYVGKENDVTIEDGVQYVYPGVFGHNDTIESVVLPKSLEKIGYNAFLHCTNLKSVIINGACTIKSKAFFCCENLRTITFAGHCEIAEDAFELCRNLTQVNGLEKYAIDREAFKETPFYKEAKN